VNPEEEKERLWWEGFADLQKKLDKVAILVQLEGGRRYGVVKEMKHGKRRIKLERWKLTPLYF